eukprot:TRINITY_DN66973_c7_g2_i1.p1 TRINITY_DN66973_c7_g2~~TRINITY_DN66973_c7_g2_i1.p1  ORF type:complete len:651 (-),score=129.33 TRINITY_DN66973_c7_g2_i1:820-2772(-)
MELPADKKEAFKALEDSKHVKLHYIGNVQWINVSGVERERILVLSQNAIFVCFSSGTIKRAINVASLDRVLVDADGTHVAFKAPDEYDLLFRTQSEEASKIVTSLFSLVARVTGKTLQQDKLTILQSQQLHLAKPDDFSPLKLCISMDNSSSTVAIASFSTPWSEAEPLERVSSVSSPHSVGFTSAAPDMHGKVQRVPTMGPGAYKKQQQAASAPPKRGVQFAATEEHQDGQGAITRKPTGFVKSVQIIDDDDDDDAKHVQFSGSTAGDMQGKIRRRPTGYHKGMRPPMMADDDEDEDDEDDDDKACGKKGGVKFASTEETQDMHGKIKRRPTTYHGRPAGGGKGGGFDGFGDEDEDEDDEDDDDEQKTVTIADAHGDMHGKIKRKATGYFKGQKPPFQVDDEDEEDEEDEEGDSKKAAVRFMANAGGTDGMKGKIQRRQTGYFKPGAKKGSGGFEDFDEDEEDEEDDDKPKKGGVRFEGGNTSGDMKGKIQRRATGYFKPGAGKGKSAGFADFGDEEDEEDEPEPECKTVQFGDTNVPDMHGKVKRRNTMYTGYKPGQYEDDEDEEDEEVDAAQITVSVKKNATAMMNQAAPDPKEVGELHAEVFNLLQRQAALHAEQKRIATELTSIHIKLCECWRGQNEAKMAGKTN